MSSIDPTLFELRSRQYDLRLAVNRLQRQVNLVPDPAQVDALLAELLRLQAELQTVEAALAPLEVAAEPPPQTQVRTLGVEVTPQLRMVHVPTAVYGLFERETLPLLTCRVRALKPGVFSVASSIEGYSAEAVDTIEIKGGAQGVEVAQLPVLRQDRAAALHELTRASVHVVVRQLGSGGSEVYHATLPVWLLSRNSAPLAVKDPATGQWNDLSRYLGAFVTPNEPSIQRFLRTVADYHPQKRLVGYEGGESVEGQVRAVFDALKEAAGIVYTNSLIDFNPEEGSRTQRVRLPRQGLGERQANCIDGSVLFASLLEAISLNPALVVIPKHVFVAWETAEGSGQWRHLETTMIAGHTFDEAYDFAERQAGVYEGQRMQTGDERWFRRWPLRELRAQHRIFPFE